MYLWKSNICSRKLDVQETNVSASQFHRLGSSFSGCAVSAYTLVKMEDVPRMLRIPKSECPDVWMWPKFLSRHWRSSGSSRTKFIRTPTCWSLVEKTVRGSLNGTWMGESAELETLFVHRKQGLFLSGYVDDIKMAGKKQAPTWKQLMNNVDLDEPTSFLDHVCLGCTQRECKLEQLKITGWEKLTHRLLRGLTT